MTATTPLWVTVLLAVLAPLLTLGGVLWTQRAADRRAEQEAKLRLEHETTIVAYNRRIDAYQKLFDHIRSMDAHSDDRSIGEMLGPRGMEPLYGVMFLGTPEMTGLVVALHQTIKAIFDGDPDARSRLVEQVLVIIDRMRVEMGNLPLV